MAHKVHGLLAAVMFLVLAAGSATAHHSAAMYDATKVVTLQGTLKRTQLSNPHSWFWLVVPNAQGGEDVWALESHGVAEFLQKWGPGAKDQLAIGQKVTITIHPLKDGRMSGQVITITLENGKTLT